MQLHGGPLGRFGEHPLDSAGGGYNTSQRSERRDGVRSGEEGEKVIAGRGGHGTSHKMD